MQFSERYGYKKIRDTIQIESMDEPLRNGLWNILTEFLWRDRHHTLNCYPLSHSSNYSIKILIQDIWINLFKQRLDTLSNDWKDVLKHIEEYFFRSDWYSPYEILEYIFNKKHIEEEYRDYFINSINNVLKIEMSAYRFVNGLIIPIIEQNEIDEIEQAINTKIDIVRIHTRLSLELLSNHQNPGYRNSIK